MAVAHAAAHHSAGRQEAPSTDPDHPDHTEPLTVDAAYARSHEAALTESVVGEVGLEIETHLVDLDDVCDAVAWDRISPMPDEVRAAAGRSSITLEPGGQLELSGPPAAGILAAVAEMRRDSQGARLALARLGLGIAHVGADPLRPPRRINPRPRYRAMEQHYAATGRAAPAAVMMTSTAALQVNLQAGPKAQWAERIARANRLGPVMVAISASSPWLHGRDTRWKSARQRAWNGLDSRACGPVPGCAPPGTSGRSGARAGTKAGTRAGTRARARARARAAANGSPSAANGSPSTAADRTTALDPADAWARYALQAPVTFVATTAGNCDDVTPVRTSVPFEQWASGAVRLAGRAPTAADLDTHLTTLFPPVRLRGYLELRYLDMTAPRWWPAIAAVVTTLMDDPVAADLATEATERTAALWTQAARDGLADARLARAAQRCVEIAASRVPAGITPAVADLAELIESRRCPGDLLAERIAEIGPHAAFEELAHA
jgi:glutamate--cysteine ligase